VSKTVLKLHCLRHYAQDAYPHGVGRMRTREKTTFCCFLIAGLGKKLSFLAQTHWKISLKIQLSFIIIHLEQRGSRGRKELGASREESLLNLLLYIAVLYIL